MTAPKSAQSLGIRANAYFDFSNRGLPGSSRQPITEYYSLDWDETNQRWSVWAEIELWEPAMEIARSAGNREREPDVFELLKAVWKQRGAETQFRLDQFETVEDFPVDPCLEARLDELEDEVKDSRQDRL